MACQKLFALLVFLFFLSTASFGCVDGTTAPGLVNQYSSNRNQAAVGGATLANPIVVEVLNWYNEPLVGGSVRYTVISGGGSVKPEVAKTNERGLAASFWTVGQSGEQTLKVEVLGPNGETSPERTYTYKANLNTLGTFKDPRDGESYQTLEVGDQVWLAENLRFKATPSFENPNNPSPKYGRMYTWSVAMVACPPGWHLPTDQEWTQMEVNLGLPEGFAGSTDRGTHGHGMKSKEGWEKGAGTNSSGFNVYPAGRCFPGDKDNATYPDLGQLGSFWTATEWVSDDPDYEEVGDKQQALLRNFGPDRSVISYINKKVIARSVRCVKDQ